MDLLLRSVLFGSLILCVYGKGYDVFSVPDSTQPAICLSPPKGGVEWILSVREPDYGWKENTHRANIALAVNREWKPDTNEEKSKMHLQLEEHIINDLLRHSSSAIPEEDLSLYIHALIATQTNPRDFHGVDLVEDLLLRVDKADSVNPFLILALCNSNAVEFRHLEKIKRYAAHHEDGHTLTSWEAEMKALALKAFACAATLPNAWNRGLTKFSHVIDQASKCLISKQVDGIFGNAYTTSLAVQALTAAGKTGWNERGALSFLKKESLINVNMAKAYYIEMALNAREVTFIKDLYPGIIEGPKVKETTEFLFLSYSIKDDTDPDVHFSVVMKIPRDSNFFEVMERAKSLSNKFDFSYILNHNKEPSIYQAIGKPNDAEENMFWMLCRQNMERQNKINFSTFSNSPVKLQPQNGEHIVLWYRNTDCSEGDKIPPDSIIRTLHIETKSIS